MVRLSCLSAWDESLTARLNSVLLEKPLTVTYEQTTQLIEIARKHQRVLYCFQNRRW